MTDTFHAICSTLEADLDRLESDMAEAGRNEVAKQRVAALVERSRATGETVALDRFTTEDEMALYDACVTADQDDGGDTTYAGPGWTVRLVGNGDPQ